MPNIRHLLHIQAPPAAVFPLVSTARGFSRWWTADTREVVAPHPGVELRFGGSPVYRLRAETFLPPAQAAWTCDSGEEWAGTQIIFLLAVEGDGTQLRLHHSDWREESDGFLASNTLWGGLLHRLKAEAEGTGAGPLFSRGEARS